MLEDERELDAGEVVSAAIRDLVEQFDDTEHAALVGEPEGVHRHRTSVRRLRSVLAVFADLYDPFAVARVRRALREWGSALGTVRDREVAADLADTLLADVATSADAARLRERLVAPERASARSAHARIVELYDLERMRELRRALHALAFEPPLTAASTDDVGTVETSLLREGRRVVRMSKRLSDSLDSHHELRKRARRLRLAIEAVRSAAPDALDDGWDAAARASHRIQSALGDHRDYLFVAARAQRARALAGRDGEDVAAYDELAARARDLADDRLPAMRKATKKLKRALESVRS